MKTLARFVFLFYVRSSIHLSIALVALTLLTVLQFRADLHLPILCIILSGSIISYNIAKYKYFFLLKKTQKIFFTALCFILLICITAIFMLMKDIKIQSVYLLVANHIICLLYSLPIIPKIRNLRSVARIKIIIVALCWALISVGIAITEKSIYINKNSIILFFQNFLWIFALILPFDIRDAQHDAPSLKTFAQSFGIKTTKVIGSLALLGVFFLCFFRNDTSIFLYTYYGIITFLSLILLNLSYENNSEFYFSFTVESLPIIGLLFYLMIEQYLK